MADDRIAAAILAGGKSTRMAGTQKALLEIGGMALIDHVIVTLRTVFDEIMIVNNAPDFRSAYSHGCRLIGDSIRDIGPLGGLHAALTAAHSDAVFVCACDMPFLDPSVIHRMIRIYAQQPCDVVLPRAGTLIEPLHAIYATRVASRLAEHVRTTRDYRIRRIFENLEVRYMQFTPGECARLFKNITTVQDLQAARRRQSSGVSGP